MFIVIFLSSAYENQGLNAMTTQVANNARAV
jgi:hypothetical protein